MCLAGIEKPVSKMLSRRLRRFLDHPAVGAALFAGFLLLVGAIASAIADAIGTTLSALCR